MMTQFIPYSGLLEDEVVFYMVVGNFVCVYLYGQLMMLLLQGEFYFNVRSLPTLKCYFDEIAETGNCVFKNYEFFFV